MLGGKGHDLGLVRCGEFQNQVGLENGSLNMGIGEKRAWL